mmetsp:Transcript_1903/g.5579  ORF Transcript_1903/g.5579 Transcript_1903/m.5579 type:complete len:92 (-) Transcript_1903:197-472(-)
MLLERGANVDAQNLGGMTPLWGAAQDGHLEVARLLLGHNADVNAADSEGRTPLWVAQIKNHDDMVISRTRTLNLNLTLTLNLTLNPRRSSL